MMDIYSKDEIDCYLDKKIVEYGFDSEAGKNWKNYMLDYKRGEDLYAWLSQIGACNADSKFLEVGCGFGAVIDGVAMHTKWVYGLDIHQDRAFFSQRRLEMRTRQLGVSLVGGILRADGLHIPFPSSTFDVLLCVDVLEHIPKEYHNILLSELARVLKNDAVLFLTVSNRLSLWDNHNGGLLLATWLPNKLHEYYTKLFVKSGKYNCTWDLTSFGFAHLVYRHGFQRIDGYSLWRFAIGHVFHHFHQLILKKKGDPC